MYRAGFITYRAHPAEGRRLTDGIRAALREGVERYDDPAAREPLHRNEQGTNRFAVELESALAENTDGRVRYDPALDLLAAEHLTGGSLPGTVNEFILRRLGFTGTLNRVHTRLVRREGPGPHLPAELAASANRDENARNLEYLFGVARQRLKDGLYLETVVLVSNRARLEPFAARTAPGESLTIEGRFLVGRRPSGGCDLRNPRLWLGGADGDVMRVELNTGDDCGFVTRVVLPGRPGNYRMQLTHTPVTVRHRRLEFHELTVAEADIEVGEGPRPEPDPSWMMPVDEPVEAKKRLAIIRRMIDEARTAAGLSPLPEDRLTTALLADQLIRAYHLRAVTSFQDITGVLEEHGVGEASLGFGGILYRVSERMGLRFADPSVRKVLLDPGTTAFGLATDPDGDVFRLVFIGRREDESDRGAGADSRVGTAGARLSLPARTSTLSADAISKAFEDRRARFVRCFRREASWVEKGYSASAGLGLAVGATGKVVAAWPEEGQADPRGLEACLLDELRAMSFPVPTHGVKGPAAVLISRRLSFTQNRKDEIRLHIEQGRF